MIDDESTTPRNTVDLSIMAVSQYEGTSLGVVTRHQFVRLASVGLAVKPVGKPDAGNPHVRFDERGRETAGCL